MPAGLGNINSHHPRLRTLGTDPQVILLVLTFEIRLTFHIILSLAHRRASFSLLHYPVLRREPDTSGYLYPQ